MPIRAELRALYPADWQTIRLVRLRAAGNRCQWCGVRNYECGYRDSSGQFHTSLLPIGSPVDGRKVFMIVLTVAHLDHDPRHNDDGNLAVLCQRCHLRYDAQHHAANAALTRRQKRLAAPA